MFCLRLQALLTTLQNILKKVKMKETDDDDKVNYWILKGRIGKISNNNDNNKKRKKK